MNILQSKEQIKYSVNTFFDVYKPKKTAFKSV